MTPKDSKHGRAPNYTRREFVTSAPVAVGAVGSLAAFGKELPSATDDLQLNAAGYPFKRFEALHKGKVTVEGCSVEFSHLGVGQV